MVKVKLVRKSKNPTKKVVGKGKLVKKVPKKSMVRRKKYA